MSQVFDRLRAEEIEKEQQNTPNPAESDEKKKEKEKEHTEFTEAAEKLMEFSEPGAMENKRQFIDMMQQYAAEIVTKKGGSVDKKVIGVNVQSDDDSLILSFEMSSKNASEEVKPMKLPKGGKRAVKRTKKHDKKPKMTIAAILERTAAALGGSGGGIGMNQHVTIAKGKSATFSISGVTIQAKEKCPATEPRGNDSAASKTNKNTNTNTNTKRTDDQAVKSTEGKFKNWNKSRPISKLTRLFHSIRNGIKLLGIH